MFKRLKEKITEEVRESPLRLQTSLQTLGQDNGNKKTSNQEPEVPNSSKDALPNLIDLQESNSSISESAQFSITEDDETGSIPSSPAGQVFAFENVDLSETSTPVNSLTRPRTSSLSASSNQSPFFTVYNPPPTRYNVQSDLESASEMEDSGVNLDVISKEQLYQAFQKAKMRYLRYKSRYADVVKAYREQENEKEKIRTILTESQDKALRRISELKEQSQLERKAKQHLEESFRITLEEKDELLRVLQVQIRLLKTGNSAIENSQIIPNLENEADTAKAKDEINAVQQTSEPLLLEELVHVEPENKLDAADANAIRIDVDSKTLEGVEGDMDENYEKIIDLDNIPRNEVVLTDHNISVDVLKDHISKHISVLQRLINNYKSSCVQMKTDVFRYKEDILNYHNVVKDQWGKLNTVHREVLQYFMDNIADMQTQKGTLKEEVFNLRRELEQCTSKLSNSLNEMEEYGRKMSAVNAEFQTVKQDRSHLNLLLKEEKEQYNKILLENTYLKEEITKASKNILELEQQIEAANVDKDELSTNIEIIKLECKEYQEKLGETKCLNNNLHEKICNLQRENETVAVKLDELKMLSCQNYSDVELSRNKIISLEELLCNATREIENLRKQLETNENTISTLENLKNELEVELSKVKSSFESEQTNLHESLAQKTNDLTDLNNEYEKLKEDLCFKDDMIESLNKMLEEKANLDDDLLQQRGNDDALLIERTEEIQQLKTNLKLENEKNVALTQHVSDNAVKFQEMEKKYMDKLKIFEEMIAEKESADFDSKQQLNMNRHLALGLSNAKQVITSFKSELNALRQQFISNRHEYDHHINIVNNEIETRISEIQKLQEAQTVQNEDYMKSNENLVQDLKNQCSSLVHEKDLLQQKVMEYAHGAEKMEIQLKRQLNERLVELRNKTSDHLAVLRRQLQTMKSGVDIENEAFQTKLKEFYIDIEKKEESLRQEQQKGRELQADYEEKILILSQTLEEANQRANAKKNAIVEERRQFNSQLNSLKLFFEDGDQELSLTSESSNELKETSEGLLRRILGTTDESSGKEDVAVRQYIKLAESSNAAVLYLKNCISKLIDEKRSLEDINNSINQSLAANTIQIKELSNCHDEKLNALESQLESTKESHKEQLETQEKLHKDKMTDLVQKFKVKLKTISAECSELRLQKEEFQRQINALQEETVKLQEANYLITANANKNVEKLSLELEMSKSELSRLTSQLESLNEIDTLKENIRNFERVIQELEAKNIASATQYQQELLQVQEEIKVNLIVTEKLQRLNEDFEQQMTFKDKIEAELKLECEELKTVLEKTRKEDLGRIKELQDVIIPLKEEVNHLKLTITAKNDEISALESQINENASWNDEKTAMMIILDDLKTQLETQKHEFDDKIQSLEEMHDNTLKSKEQYFNEQTQIKLAELKKKAESRLLQIKKQLHLESDKVKDLENKVAELLEKYKDTDSVLEEKNAEISQLQLTLSETKKNYDNEINNLNSTLTNEKAHHAKEKENLHAEIATKNSQIDESLINAQVNHMEMTQKLNALQAAFDEAKANWKLKETVESDSSFASSQENHNLHKESQTNEEGEVARERLGCVDQIENCRPLMNENEIQLRRKDDEHVAKIKQLVKEFSKMIALKEEEGRQALVKAIECNIQEDNRLRRDHACQLRALQEELVDKEQLFDSIVEEKDKLIEEKNVEVARLSRTHDELVAKIKTDHQDEIANLERKWKTFLQKKLDQQVTMQEEDLKALSHEWDIERKFSENDFSCVAKIDIVQEELQHQANLALTAVESGNQSIDLLRRQIMNMHSQMEALKEKHKAEVCELHDLLQSKKPLAVPSSQSTGRDFYDESYKLKSLEIEYLKNILFEYMMGRETVTLAKVIAAVVKFSDEQLNKILEKEQSRGAGVSGQLVQLLK